MGFDNFLGQIALTGFNFAPNGWAFAQGQILAISQNTALFSLLGTFYGGNGTSNFGLPNLQGNVALGMGGGPGLTTYSLGETGGTPNVTLLLSELPQHTHVLQGVSQKADQADPTNMSLANGEDANNVAVHFYAAGSPNVPMAPNLLTSMGGNQPHNNMMPYLSLNWIIALTGIFPARG